MKKIFFTAVASFASLSFCFSQIMPLTLEPDGGNKKAGISEQIGIVRIAISYNRPGVKGREGKIWGTPIAHYGFVDQGHGIAHQLAANDQNAAERGVFGIPTFFVDGEMFFGNDRLHFVRAHLEAANKVSGK